jgi:predicted homoserine dehydrogenase-like protein
LISEKIIKDLKAREKDRNPIKMAVVGTGFIGRGLINQVNLMKGIRTVAVANRNIDKAIEVVNGLGENVKYVICKNTNEADTAIKDGKIAVTNNPLILTGTNVDIVVDCTGDPQFGADLALSAIKNNKHFIANPEMDATVGPVLNKMAKEKGIVYSGAEGDEPGVIMGLYRYIALLGLEVVSAGKFKGYYNPHATPLSVKPWADKAEQSPIKICSFADGTKMSIEMTLVSNATGLVPDVRGMNVPTATLDTLTDILKTKEEGGILSRAGAVEVVRGVEPSGGVFVIARTEHPRIRKDLKYYKMGNGPNYLFYRPYHLCSFEMAIGVARAVLYKEATISPIGSPVADVFAVAKRDLNPGDELDAIGGFTFYGLIEHAYITKRERLLSVGLAQGAKIVKKIRKDTPITLNDVELNSDLSVWKLRQQYNEML